MFIFGYVRVSLFFIAVFLFAPFAIADFVDRDKVMEMIESGQRLDAANAIEGDEQLDAQFTGYVQGLVDSLVHMKVLCLPARTSIEQIQEMVVKYAKANPKLQNGSGAGIVFFALPTRYRCKK